jgi:hypothetical protein
LVQGLVRVCSHARDRVSVSIDSDVVPTVILQHPLSFPPTNQGPLQQTPLFPTREKMADQSGSHRFQALFESALQAYGRKTGVTLAQHPLAVQLQSCHSVDDITTLLQERAQAFGNFRERDRMMKSIETTVSILTPLSDAAPLADALGVVCQKALVACFTSLIIFTDIVPTYEGDTGWSRCPTRCMYRSLIHMWISY